MVQLIEWLSGKLELFRLRTGRLWLQHSFDVCNGNRKSIFFLSQSECGVRLYVTLLLLLVKVVKSQIQHIRVNRTPTAQISTWSSLFAKGSFPLAGPL